MPNLYLVEAHDPHNNDEVVGTEYLLADTWVEAMQKARPHWPTGSIMWARICNEAELELYLEYHCP